MLLCGSEWVGEIQSCPATPVLYMYMCGTKSLRVGILLVCNILCTGIKFAGHSKTSMHGKCDL